LQTTTPRPGLLQSSLSPAFATAETNCAPAPVPNPPTTNGAPYATPEQPRTRPETGCRHCGACLPWGKASLVVRWVNLAHRCPVLLAGTGLAPREALGCPILRGVAHLLLAPRREAPLRKPPSTAVASGCGQEAAAQVQLRNYRNCQSLARHACQRKYPRGDSSAAQESPPPHPSRNRPGSQISSAPTPPPTPPPPSPGPRATPTAPRAFPQAGARAPLGATVPALFHSPSRTWP